MRRTTYRYLIAAVALVAGSNARAQQPEPARMLVLGTFHFANPGLDVLKTEVADVLSPAKQSEIARIIDALARFRPTKIAVEHSPAMSDTLNAAYRAYREKKGELTRNETQQIGFRLAARLGHDRVYPIDHRGEFPFGPLMEYAQRHDTAFVTLVRAEMARMQTETNARQRECSIGDILRLSNEPTKLAKDHAMYLRFARVGAGDSQVGADLLSKWYERNIRIFTNLQAITSPGDRVLVIIGSGHAPILRELITYDAGMTLENTLAFLPPNAQCR